MLCLLVLWGSCARVSHKFFSNQAVYMHVSPYLDIIHLQCSSCGTFAYAFLIMVVELFIRSLSAPVKSLAGVLFIKLRTFEI